MKSNFDFLNRYWPALAQIGATAETYVYSDPNACIYKLGMFAERLVQEILVFEHIAEPAVDNTHANRIRILKRAGLLPQAAAWAACIKKEEPPIHCLPMESGLPESIHPITYPGAL